MPASMSPAEIVTTREYRLMRAALIRTHIGLKPTTTEAAAVHTLALLMERARLGATDPNVSPDMLVKLNAAVKRARSLLIEVCAERHGRHRKSAPSLSRLVERARQSGATA